MTELYIDDNIIEYEDTDNNSTIGDFIREVEGQLSGVKQLIVAIEVDGDVQEDLYSKELLDIPVADRKEIRLSTAPLKALLEVGINTCNEYIVHIKGAIVVIVDALRAGKNDEVFKLLPGLFESLNEVIKTLAVINANVVRYNLEIFKDSPTSYYDALVVHLGELLSAKDSDDLILVGDLLDYEILPIVDALEKLLLEVDINF